MNASGDGFNFGRFCVWCGIVMTCSHSLGFPHTLEKIKEEKKEGGGIYKAVTAEESSDHAHPEEHSSKIHRSEYARTASGSTLTFMQHQLFEQQKIGKLPISIDGLQLIVVNH